MKFNDAKVPQDTIEAVIRREAHGDLIEIEIQGDRAECVYLTKKDASDFGKHLMALSEHLADNAVLSGAAKRSRLENIVCGVSMNWISVKERLPEKGQNVICAAKMDGETWWFGCCKYIKGFPWTTVNNPDPIEFWAPLPEPPSI